MNNRRRLTGVVKSDKMMKTVVVEVTRTYLHPLYRKVVHASSRFKAHDELDAKVGDVVLIVESRPLSRGKRWVVEKIVRRPGEGAVAGEIDTDATAEEAAEGAPAGTPEEAPAAENTTTEAVEGE